MNLGEERERCQRGEAWTPAIRRHAQLAWLHQRRGEHERARALWRRAAEAGDELAYHALMGAWRGGDEDWKVVTARFSAARDARPKGRVHRG